MPLRVDEAGAVRVGASRVSLETVLHHFNLGATPEEIVVNFPTLELADVFAVCAYYLRHRAEVDSYLARCQAEEDVLRRDARSRPGVGRLRDLASVRQRERHAAAGG